MGGSLGVIMKKRYDFSKGIRGKFYRPNLVLSLPIYLDAKFQKRVEEITRKQPRVRKPL
jgi:hypothetical protein